MNQMGRAAGPLGQLNPSLNPLTPRERLKMQLHIRRTEYRIGEGWSITCPLCRKPIVGIGDLHEGLISRGKAQGPDQDLIYHPCNCVEVHHKCHMKLQGLGSITGFKKCVQYLMEREGYDAVLAWLLEISDTFPEAAQEAIQRMKAVAEE